MATSSEAKAFEHEYPGARWLSSRAARMLELAGANVEARISATARRHGLSHAALNALAVIEGAGRPLTPGEVGATMHITSGSITSLIDGLVKQGLVVRSAHEDDRRKILLEVTERGNDVLDAVLPEVQVLSRALLSQLDEHEQARLIELLERVIASADAVADDDLPTPGARRNPRRPR